MSCYLTFDVGCIYLRTTLKLLASVYTCKTPYELFHYVDISIKIFGLDFNLLIIYNFDFIIAYGDFFKQLRERLYVGKSSNKNGKGNLTVLFYFSIIIYVILFSLKSSKLLDTYLANSCPFYETLSVRDYSVSLFQLLSIFHGLFSFFF